MQLYCRMNVFLFPDNLISRLVQRPWIGLNEPNLDEYTTNIWGSFSVDLLYLGNRGGSNSKEEVGI